MSQPQVSSRVWTLPNVISLIRLILVPVFAFLVATTQWGAAIAVLAVCGISDWADGFLARRLGQVTRLGQILDPAADRLFILITLFAFGWAQVVPWWLVIAVVGRDVVLAGMLPVLARHGYGPLPVAYVGKAGTFALMCAFPVLLLAQFAGPVSGFVHVVGWAFAGWGLALYWVAGAVYLLQATRLTRSPA